MLYALSLIGVGLFAASGALAAGRRRFDLMGVFVLALVTALGGGSVRDILLRREIFWLADQSYLWTALAAGALTPLYVRFMNPPDRVLLIADAFGVALFSIGGVQLAEQHGVTGLGAVLMGACTGAVGGVLRDVLTREVPLLFSPHEPLYATAILAGSALYLLGCAVGISANSAALCGMFVIAALRLAAIVWNWRLPVFTVD